MSIFIRNLRNENERQFWVSKDHLRATILILFSWMAIGGAAGFVVGAMTSDFFTVGVQTPGNWLHNLDQRSELHLACWTRRPPPFLSPFKLPTGNLVALLTRFYCLARLRCPE